MFNIFNKSSKQTIMRNADIQNDNAKRIVRYKPSDIEAFFNGQPYPSNIVVSGGKIDLRARCISGAVVAAHIQGIPVVILHAGNSILQNTIKKDFSGRNFVCINNTNPIYDPFIGLSNVEITKLVMSSAANGCEIKSAGKYYIDGMTDYIVAKGIKPYLDTYINCPHLDLFDRIDKAETARQITSQVAQSVKSKIVQGQTERNNIEYFFDTLGQQGGSIFVKKNNMHQAESISKIVHKKAVSIIDITSSANSQVINLLSNEILSVLSKGQRMLLVADSISIEASEILTKIVKSNFQNFSFMLVADDAYSALAGNDNIFNSLVGSASKFVVMRHSSAISAGMWSKAIGDYDKQEVTSGVNTQKTYRTPFTFFPGRTSGENVNIGIKRENRVKPEEILKMSAVEAYIYDAQIQEFAHTEIK